MDRLKFQAEDSGLQPHVAAPAGGSGRRWVIGLVAAAAVAVTVGLAVLAPHRGEDRTSPTPDPAPDSAQSADRAAAQAVAVAFAAHDPDAAMPHLAQGAELWHGWRRHWERDEAWGVEVLMEPCAGPPSTVGTFTCPFAMHLLGSREVGSGPFPDNALTVRVTDGQVTSADRHIPYDTNGVGQHLDSVFTWIEATHPDDAAFLEKDELELTQRQWSRWRRLWEQYTAEYVAANGAG